MDPREFERFQLSEEQIYCPCQLLPVMDKVVALLRELYPEILQPDAPKRLPKNLYLELAPSNFAHREPLLNAPEGTAATRRRHLVKTHDRDRVRRPLPKK